MATANIIVAAASTLTAPPSGEATLFINTENSNILSLMYSDGSVRAYSDASSDLSDCCTCDIAKKIVDSVTCAFSSGMITSNEFGILMGTGFVVTSTSGFDTNGNKTTTVEIGTKNVAVTGMSIDNSSPIAMHCSGTTVQLTATVLPANASNKKVKWLSSNIAVATVDINTGLVTETGTGTCTITAYTDDGGFTDTVTINSDQTGC